MAKPPKKQATPKSTETNEIMVATVDVPEALPKTPEQAMQELVELSQELGLYGVEGNPLVKDDSTVPAEAPTEAVGGDYTETNATVAQTDETPSSIGLEPLNATAEDAALLDELLDEVTDENKHPELLKEAHLLLDKVEDNISTLAALTKDSDKVDDKLTLKDAWGRPIPTTLITLQTVNYTELASHVLYLSYLGAEIDKSYRITTTVPYRIRLLLPTGNYDKWLSKEDMMVYDDNTSYNRVLIRGFSLYPFWDNIVKIGKSGAIVVPRQVVQRVGGYLVPILTKAPIADKPESRISREKIAYTKDELESFKLEDLRIIGDWYNLPPSNSKLKYIKPILDKQRNQYGK